VSDEPISIRAYDPAWQAGFQREARILTDALGSYITGGVHHIGSTAVPGLAAKPIIDIMIGVADLESSRPCIELLADLDYCYAPYRHDVMHWFCKPTPARRTHHLHLVPTGAPRFTDVLIFRDHLRAHPDAARRYEQLKRELADRYTGDRDAYTDGKSAMVAELTAEAHRWLAGKGRGRVR
jgi:GrpB-like predicted nucleotidyltransferase (UPF0157 family)